MLGNKHDQLSTPVIREASSNNPQLLSTIFIKIEIKIAPNSLLDDDRRPGPEDLPHLVEAHVEDEVGVGERARLNHPPAERAEALTHLVGAKIVQ